MIRVVVGRLADQATEGVLRPVRADLAPVSVGSRDIAQLAGEELANKLQRLGPMPIGGAVITPAGELPSDFLIHAVVSSEEEPETPLSVQRALRNGLRRAVDMSLESLSLPPLGMGVGTMEPEAAAHVLVEILFHHLDDGQPPLELTIVVASDFEAALFERLVEAFTRDRAAEWN